MADLENLLLEAAGRTSLARRNRKQLPPSRKHHEGSYSDGGSDSRDEDSDDERNYARRKPSRSQVPLKKRFDLSERDNEHESHEERNHDSGFDHEGNISDESDVGSDLYKDDNDRQRLAEMTELEREMILSERASKKNDKVLKEKLRSKGNSVTSALSRKGTPPLPSAGRVRASARSAERTAAKHDALSELRAKRLKQQDSEAHHKSKDASRGSSGSQGISPIKQKAFIAANSSSSSESESVSRSDSEDEESTGEGFVDSDEDGSMPGSEVPTFEDIKEITIRRSNLAKWFMEPFFEELIVGCFVRIGIGRSKVESIYRLCLVQGVDATCPDQQYKLEGKITHKYLNCVWGSDSSAARWQMAMVSDSAPREEEFKQWVREMERSGCRMPRKQAVLEKRESILKPYTYVYSAATVKQMLQEKKSTTSRPLNIAVEKDRLRRQLEVAVSKHDEVEVERIKTKLQELEATRLPLEKDAKAIRLSEMNRKNRFENFKNASTMKSVNASLKAGEDGYDPFSRRWTRSRNYYDPKPGEDNEDKAANNGTASADKNGTGSKVTTEAGMETTEAALEAAAGAGKLVDTSAPVDHGTVSNIMHNFELPISLATLQSFGGPQGAQRGFLARKQKIEATVGYRVPENDGKRHALTLTISDYKRRRGLLECDDQR
ncbi:protein RTF1 homolog [Quercus robur]|uniref:protein RTF1 homolog n=1 Tax=Quercus robur TaxID=38942 RepID=UPI0021637EC1|nr:protein RTF1 homolog [Quercus robur]XP_050273737.1 protein RTF1 homolog [Quercus robur]XP_050273738.1 protein RTF1 homolog [Quercus robur]